MTQSLRLYHGYKVWLLWAKAGCQGWSLGSYILSDRDIGIVHAKCVSRRLLLSSIIGLQGIWAIFGVLSEISGKIVRPSVPAMLSK